MMLLSGNYSGKTIFSQETNETSFRGRILACLLPGILGALLCVLNNFVFLSTRIMLSTDGKHYLTTIQNLYAIIRSYAAGDPDLSLWGMSGLGGHLLLDGPIMAVFYGLPFSFLNHIPGPRDWPLMAIGQILVHAFSAMLVAALALRVTRNTFFSCLGACFFAAYPSAVLQTGHFMSETPVTFLLLVLIFGLTNPHRPFFAAILAGLSGALIVSGKPALAPAILLLIFFALLQFQNKIKTTLLLIGTAACLVFIPWASYCQHLTGHLTLTAQRQPTYNVAKGWNTEADGWGFNPHPPLTDLYNDSDGPINAAYGLIYSHPEQSAKLALRKVSRLFSLPWNDFKNRVLGLDMNVQILIHRLLISLGFFGIVLFLMYGYKQSEPIRRLPLELSILLCLGHLSYILVESTARYSFTMIPFVVLLAIYGLWQAGHLFVPEKNRKVIIAMAVCLAIMATSLLVHAEKLTYYGDSFANDEIAHNLSYGQAVEKIFNFKGVSVPEKIQSVFVLVDGDKEIEKSDIYVNGQKLALKPLSVMHFDASRYAVFDQMREFAPAMGVNACDFRQWRAVPVPTSFLNLKGNNSVTLRCQSKTSLIYADSNSAERSIFSPNYCNYGLLASSPLSSGAESRYRDPVLAAAIKQQSLLKTGALEPAKNLSESLRIRLAFVLPPVNEPVAEVFELAAPKHIDTQIIKIQRQSFDPLLWDNASTDCLRMNKTILYAARSNAGLFKLPELGTYSHLKLRLTGELKANSNPGEVGILCAVVGKHNDLTVLGKTPRAIVASSAWHNFAIEDILPRKLFKSGPDAFCLSFYPGPWTEGQYGASRKSCDCVFRNLKVECSGIQLPELSSTKVIYY